MMVPSIKGVAWNEYTRGMEYYKYISYQYTSSTYREERGLKLGARRPAQELGRYSTLVKVRQRERSRGGTSQRRSRLQWGLLNERVLHPTCSEKHFQERDDLVLLNKSPESFVRIFCQLESGRVQCVARQTTRLCTTWPTRECTCWGPCANRRLWSTRTELRISRGSRGLARDHGYRRRGAGGGQGLGYRPLLLGGSPGNLGVLTYFTLKVHRDVDYEGSKGMKALYLYDSNTLR